MCVIDIVFAEPEIANLNNVHMLKLKNEKKLNNEKNLKNENESGTCH